MQQLLAQSYKKQIASQKLSQTHQEQRFIGKPLSQSTTIYFEAPAPSIQA